MFLVLFRSTNLNFDRKFFLCLVCYFRVVIVSFYSRLSISYLPSFQFLFVSEPKKRTPFIA